MSGVVKSIGKIFKKVLKVVKKILPIVLAVAAVVFTAGSALGVAFAAGGWGSAAASVGTSLGLGPAATSIVSGAITQAGYGAAVGGILGGKKGMEMGALTGAVSGGVMGGLGMATDPLGGAAAKGTSSNAALDAWTGTGPGGATGAGAPLTGPATAQVGGGVSGAGPATTPVGGGISGTGAVGAPSDGGGLLGKVMGQGGWIERNQGLVGNMVSGLGQGLMGSGEADAMAKARAEEWNRIAGSYSVGPEAHIGDWEGDETKRPTPNQVYRRTNRFSGRYEYNPREGRITYSKEG
jgi:hypothetical protein